MALTKVILDTDIGDDIDDALALALICCLPELELVGVTTVYGNTAARARQAQTVLAAGAKFARIPVAVGCAGAMASRKNVTPVADPENVPGQDSASWPAEKLPAVDAKHGVEFLIEHLMQGDVVPVTIGALTNVAMALVKEPRLVKKIPKIMTMAAEFQKNMAEWNIKCDPEAAHLVFASGIPMEVIPFTIGIEATFTQGEVERMDASGRPLAKYLSAAIAAWRVAWKNPKVLPHLFDPMAVAAIVKPELFEWKTGQASVELAGMHTYAYTTFKEGEGPHKVAWHTEREAAVGWYLKQLLGE